LAAKASYCAGDQGKYWEYLKAVYAENVLLTRDGFQEIAESVVVSRPDLFDACLLADKYDLHLRWQLREGAKLEISALPTVFVGERRLDGLPKAEEFWDLIEEQL
jgi:protein-disulfide isomerase